MRYNYLMVRSLIYRAEEEEGPGVISGVAWRAHFKGEQLYQIDERDKDGNGIIRLVTYDPKGKKPPRYGEKEFTFPDDAEEYRRFIGG
jgi:hypothetical protein